VDTGCSLAPLVVPGRRPAPPVSKPPTSVTSTGCVDRLWLIQRRAAFRVVIAGVIVVAAIFAARFVGSAVRRPRRVARRLRAVFVRAILVGAMALAAGFATRLLAFGAVVFLFLRARLGRHCSANSASRSGDRNAVVVGMDFAEGEETVAVSAVVHETGLQRGFHAHDAREIDVPFELLLRGGFEIEIVETVAADHRDPSFFRVRGCRSTYAAP